MSASATRTDSLYTFRFVQGKDAFYVPWRENGTQLGQLTDLLQSHREAVVNGSIPVVVNGYCTGQASRQENLHMAAVHSNRVKSELIVRTDIFCQPTGDHQRGRLAQFFLDALHHAVDEHRRTHHRAGKHAFFGIGADGALGRTQMHLRQLGAALP